MNVQLSILIKSVLRNWKSVCSVYPKSFNGQVGSGKMLELRSRSVPEGITELWAYLNKWLHSQDPATDHPHHYL